MILLWSVLGIGVIHILFPTIKTLACRLWKGAFILDLTAYFTRVLSNISGLLVSSQFLLYQRGHMDTKSTTFMSTTTNSRSLCVFYQLSPSCRSIPWAFLFILFIYLFICLLIKLIKCIGFLKSYWPMSSADFEASEVRGLDLFLSTADSNVW